MRGQFLDSWFPKKDSMKCVNLVLNITEPEWLHQSIFSAEARQNITLNTVMRLPDLLEIGLQTVSFAKSAYLAATHILYNSQGLRHSSLDLHNLRGFESVVP